MFAVPFLVLLSATSVLGANILFVSIAPSPSHQIWNRVLAFGLAKKGHNVTMVGPDQHQTNFANYTNIYLEGVYEGFRANLNCLQIAETTPVQTILDYVNLCYYVCEAAIKSQGLQQLLNYPLNYKFDLIVFETTVGSCLYPLIQRFNYPPTIGVTPFLLPAFMAYNFGNHLYSAYVPWYNVPYNNHMTFMERLWNTIFTYGETLIKNTYQMKLEYESAKKAFGQDVPPIKELERHISLLLVNYDPVLNYPQPLAPNIIPVGGLHTQNSKELPQDLLQILDGAKNGVIVFALGTNVRSDSLDKRAQRALVDAFGKLEEVVIWKFESEIERLPKNVIVRKWLPQNDLLGHRNIKLFIGHGGGLSTQEAIFHGVPMISVPFFFDQHVITGHLVAKKVGVSLDYKKISSEYVLEKIREVLDNPIYWRNMQQMSRIFKDRLETPLERGIFWVEYVIRHGGAQFLNSPARDMPFYKASGLDVLIFLFSIIVTIIFLLCRAVRLVLGRHKSTEKVKVN